MGADEHRSSAWIFEVADHIIADFMAVYDSCTLHYGIVRAQDTVESLLRTTSRMKDMLSLNMSLRRGVCVGVLALAFLCGATPCSLLQIGVTGGPRLAGAVECNPRQMPQPAQHVSAAFAKPWLQLFALAKV